MGFIHLTNILQECTFKVMTKCQVAAKALLREMREKRCNRARLFVKESNKERPKRLVRYAQEKQAAVNGIMRAPYVEVRWVLPDGTCTKRRGLFDTGADWSIIRKDALTHEELRSMQPTLMEGQGVCKDALPIIGEIWSDIYLGDVLMKNHRFIVVKDMVAALILGVDL